MGNARAALTRFPSLRPKAGYPAQPPWRPKGRPPCAAALAPKAPALYLCIGMPTLYIVSTPIGNLGDITYRAVEILGAVDRILAEDTRHTAILLRKYGITTSLVSAHEHNEAARTEQVLGWLDGGENLALVSDAGTPLLSDPGARIVRAAAAAGHAVVPIPGASALLAALVVSGFEPEPFSFYGFLPRKGGGRKALLAELAGVRHTCVLYEAPGRIAALLEDLANACEIDRRVVVARELTKLHETVVRGTLAEVAAYYHEAPTRGEIVVVLEGASTAAADVADPQAFARELLARGLKPSAAARELAQATGLSRAEAYEQILSASE